MWQSAAVCVSVLQCVAGSSFSVLFGRVLQVRCSAVQCVAVCGSVLQCVSVCCSVLQGHPFQNSSGGCTMTAPQSNLRYGAFVFLFELLVPCSCSELQCVAVCRSVSQCVTVCRIVLQCVAVCCSTLQCVAVSCSVLQ